MKAVMILGGHRVDLVNDEKRRPTFFWTFLHHHRAIVRCSSSLAANSPSYIVAAVVLDRGRTRRGEGRVCVM